MTTPPAAPGPAATPDEPSSLVGVVNTALRHVRLLVVVPLVAMVLAGGLALLMGSSYVAESTFKPESRRISGGGLAGMASQFGFDLAGLSEGESVDYYAQLMKSREILTDALRSVYTVDGPDGGARQADLLTLYEVEGPTEQRRLWNGVLRLRRDVGVSVDHASSLVFVATTAPTPELAEQLNARLLELLNRFNLEKRRSQARAEREFVEAQVAAAAAELEAAEDRLARFLEQNRRYRNSPELANEADRLERRVTLRQQVYTSLAQSYEEAKLDEVRNTPVFTVLDRPEGSARETGGPLKAAVLGFLLGLVVAAFWVFLREYIASQRRRHPDEFRELDGRLARLRHRLLPFRRSRSAAPDPGATTTDRAPARREHAAPPPAHHGS